jgi:hypothetical protein
MPNTVAKRTMPVGRPFPPGVSGNPGGSSRARRDLNADTIREMHRAFREGGREAIDKVMKTQPAVFLKLLVLLVPRELEVTRSGGVKSMSDEQIEAAIEVITDMLAKREAGESAKVVEGVAGPPGETPTPPTPRKTRKKRSDASPMLPDAVPGEDGGSTP